LRGIYGSLNDHRSLFIGNPLILSIIADVYEGHLKDIESATVSIDDWLGQIENFSPNITNLFEKFVRGKYDVYFKEKFRMDASTVAAKLIYGKLEKEFDRMHTILALKSVFGREDYEVFCKDPKLQILEDFESVFRGGIVYTIEEQIRFIHKTFAEYFVAKFLLQNFQDYKDFIVRKVLVDQDLKMVRIFINCEMGDYQGTLQGSFDGPTLLIAAKEKDLKTLAILFDSLYQKSPESCKVVLQTQGQDDRTIIQYYLESHPDNFSFLQDIREKLGVEFLMDLLATTNQDSENSLFFANRGGVFPPFLEWLKREDKGVLKKLIIQKNRYGYNVLRYVLSAYLGEQQVLDVSYRVLRWVNSVLGRDTLTDIFFLHRDSQLTFLHNLVLSCASKKDFGKTILDFLGFLKNELKMEKNFLKDLFLHEDVHQMTVLHLYIFETPNVEAISGNILLILSWLHQNCKFDEKYAFCLFTTPAYDGVCLLKRLALKCPNDYQEFICELQMLVGKDFDLSFIENMEP
jgi:hypothetical protein